MPGYRFLCTLGWGVQYLSVIFQTRFAGSYAYAPRFTFTRYYRFFFRAFAVVQLAIHVSEALHFIATNSLPMWFFGCELGNVIRQPRPIWDTALYDDQAIYVRPIRSIFDGRQRRELDRFFSYFIRYFKEFITIFARYFMLDRRWALSDPRRDSAFADRVKVGFLLRYHFRRVT